MIKVNASELQFFNYCVEQLLVTFINIKKDQERWTENLDTSKFRIPIKLHYTQQGKKFIVPTKVGQHSFSRREIECLQCLIEGFSAKETGNKLFLSSRTVETYLDNIKYKLNCRTKREIIHLIYIQ